MSFDSVRYRLHNDFQLAILTFLGSLAVVGITPFAIYRAIAHEWSAFVVDICVIAGISGGVVYAWRSGDSRRPSTFLCYFVGVMAVIASHVLGVHGTYWIYPALIANFFLAPRKHAANFFLAPRKHAFAIAIGVLALIMLTGGWYREAREAASFAVTLILSVLLAYVFAYRTEQQHEQLRRLASLDALTGIYNRRALYDELERTQKVLMREGKAHGLLMLDLDYFKTINDRFGHAQGDAVLVRFARLLEGTLRPLDRLFRYGGEEFVILTQVNDAATLHAIAEKLRLAAERSLDDGHGKTVTTSIGGALLRPGESIAAWIARADDALYRAKHGGRNRVVIDAGA